MKPKEMSYCVIGQETLDLTAKIREWIQKHQAEGWTVEFSVRADGEQLGVMWHCTTHVHGRKAEFTPYITMAGTEGRMN